MQQSIDGVIIKERDIGEDDKVLTILTRQYGLMEAFARGVRRMKSKLSAACGVFCYSDFVLYKGRNQVIVNSADLKSGFFGIRYDLVKTALAFYLSDITAAIAAENEESQELLRLYLNSLHLLEKGQKPNELIKAVYELRGLCIFGVMPHLSSCGECDASFANEEGFFDLQSGTIYCRACAEHQKNAHAMKRISPRIRAAVQYIAVSEMDKLWRLQPQGEEMRELSEICEEYLHSQLSRSFGTLDFYKQLLLPLSEDKNKEE